MVLGLFDHFKNGTGFARVGKSSAGSQSLLIGGVDRWRKRLDSGALGSQRHQNRPANFASKQGVHGVDDNRFACPCSPGENMISVDMEVQAGR